jgi:hypothetical protein
MPDAAGLQKDADILRALDDGTLKEASLDVFEVEPLPRDQPAVDASEGVRHAARRARRLTPLHLVRAPMLAQMDAPSSAASRCGQLRWSDSGLSANVTKGFEPLAELSRTANLEHRTDYSSLGETSIIINGSR